MNAKTSLLFYGDDFTGSTDAMERLWLGGWRARLYLQPPSLEQVQNLKDLDAIGIAGYTRSMPPSQAASILRRVFRWCEQLHPRFVHYKICSTFDSSPSVGNIARVVREGREVFSCGVVPILAAAPSLGRYTAFGHHFASTSIGNNDRVHRLDRHPAVSEHPVTPMNESDLIRHLQSQGMGSMLNFDIRDLEKPWHSSLRAWQHYMNQTIEGLLVDATHPRHLKRIGKILHHNASLCSSTQFLVGSSGISEAITIQTPPFRLDDSDSHVATQCSKDDSPMLTLSGSCSPVTGEQVSFAKSAGIKVIYLDPFCLLDTTDHPNQCRRLINQAAMILKQGHHLIVHTNQGGPNQTLKPEIAAQLSRAIGRCFAKVASTLFQRLGLNRLCLAGGDTSSHTAKAMRLEALEVAAPLMTGAPICRMLSKRNHFLNKMIVFKGGQVGEVSCLVDMMRDGLFVGKVRCT